MAFEYQRSYQRPAPTQLPAASTRDAPAGPLVETLLPWAIIVLGIVMRLRWYLAERSLWYDESMVALNILGRSFSELTRSLDYDQGAPVGWLWLSKLATLALGGDELALRVVPLAFGIIALIAVYYAARTMLGAWPGLIAVGLFALLERQLYYATEVKQYTSDIAFTALILWAGAVVARHGLQRRNGLALLAIGIVAVYCSHPSVFILAATGGTLIVAAAVRRHQRQAWMLCAISATWLANFAVTYFAFTGAALRANERMMDYWARGFAPLPTAWGSINWYINAGLHLFDRKVGALGDAAALAAALFVLGLIAAWRRDRRLAWMLALPIVLVVIASLGRLRLYAFHERLLLFLTPLLVIAIAAGIEYIWSIPHRRARIAAAVLGVLLVIRPVYGAVDSMMRPPAVEELRPVLDEVEARVQPNDTVVLYFGAEPIFRYYIEYHDYPRLAARPVTVTSSFDGKAYLDAEAELLALPRQPRVWFILAHRRDWSGFDDEKFYLLTLGRIGTPIEQFRARGASATLFDLTTNDTAPPAALE